MIDKSPQLAASMLQRQFTTCLLRWCPLYATPFVANLFFASLFFATITTGMAAGPGSAGGVVVVRPASWSEALSDWKAYRTAQGYAVAEIDSNPDPRAIREQIIELSRQTNPKFHSVLLAGDVSSNRDVHVPTFYHQSTAMVQFGGDPVISSDNDYGDLDGDDIPDLGVGRIPADSPEQLRQVLDRVIAFERNEDFADWRRDIHIVAGVGGFGAIADSVIEMTTRSFLSDRVPGWSAVTMTQASVDSCYCPDPDRFSEACLDRMNAGGMFWVYIGHGHVKNLDYLRVENQFLPIMTTEHLPLVNTGSHSPVALFLACYTGAFDALEDSLAERLVLQDQGPIAAIAASRVSGPYGLAMLADGLLDGCFVNQANSLGQIFLYAKQKTLQPDTASPAAEPSGHSGNASQLPMIEAIAQAMSPIDYDLRAERLEHVWQVNLLGDPLLRISRPSIIDFTTPDTAAPGETIEITGSEQQSGELMAELIYLRGRVPTDEEDAIEASKPTARENKQQSYLKSNNQQIAVSRMEHIGGDFTLTLPVPHELKRGKYAVRLHLKSTARWLAGYSELRVRPKSVDAGSNN